MTMNYSYGKENIPFLFTVGYIGYMIFHLVIGGRGHPSTWSTVYLKFI